MRRWTQGVGVVAALLGGAGCGSCGAPQPTAQLVANVDGQARPIRSVHAFEWAAGADGATPMLEFYVDAIACDDPQWTHRERLSAVLSASSFQVGGPQPLDQWSYTDFSGVPLEDRHQGDDQLPKGTHVRLGVTHPAATAAQDVPPTDPENLAELALHEVEEDAVRGEAVFTRGDEISMKGSFVALRCPPR